MFDYRVTWRNLKPLRDGVCHSRPVRQARGCAKLHTSLDHGDAMTQALWTNRWLEMELAKQGKATVQAGSPVRLYKLVQCSPWYPGARGDAIAELVVPANTIIRTRPEWRPDGGGRYLPAFTATHTLRGSLGTPHPERARVDAVRDLSPKFPHDPWIKRHCFGIDDLLYQQDLVVGSPARPTDLEVVVDDATADAITTPPGIRAFFSPDDAVTGLARYPAAFTRCRKWLSLPTCHRIIR